MADATKTAIVTGAGSGIGLAVASQLASAGFNVALAGRTTSKLKAAAAAIQDERDVPAERLLVAPADIADADACARLVAQAVETFGRLDALVNVAGYAAQVAIDRIDEAEWRRMIDTNLTSVVLLTAAAWPHLKKQGGVIVNVSSMASIDPFPQFAMYAAAKAGVNLFTHCTAVEGKPLGIRAVAVAPGAVETGMLRAMFSEKMLPADKTLDPTEVAAVICDCITGNRAFEPGETIQLPSP